LAAPALARAGRPEIAHGLQTGDVTRTSGMVWSRADRPSRMIVEWATDESFRNARRIVGPAALDVTDYTAKLDLTDLPAGEQIHYRVSFASLADDKAVSELVTGRFRTAPADRRSVSFTWSGDTAGQGWGINEEFGGMKIYGAMHRDAPDFFIHSGDTIYADGPLKPEVTLPDGSLWKNVVIPEKTKVAETLAEFRGNFRYNLMDANVRALNAEVPVFAQWDDHETVNNWYPAEILDREEYSEKSVALLAARANRAFHEYFPTRQTANDPERIYRKVEYGPLLDVFFLDMRSYRGDNGANDQAQASNATAFLGAEQMRWLKQALLGSRATWKVIAADMPIGIIVRDGKTAFENGANGNGPVRGREHEFADLLRFIRDNDVQNTVWVTADVHYTAAHHYDPAKAQFKDFKPFWEFVSGPLNAGSFGPGEMDDTFGPEVVFVKSPEGRANLSPKEGLQFYGHAAIDGESEALTVTLKDLNGTSLWSTTLMPEGRV
ncbi:MAG: alkaline phosphatase D family protein, partial [Caenispirillum sp.]|nr:alkaline phosphatase D family protein [Caenispirillum sp.]